MARNPEDRDQDRHVPGRDDRSRHAAGQDAEDRDARDLGSDSPASDEAAEQTRSGARGAARGQGETGGTDRQPSQSSGRSGSDPDARARKHYEEGERPSAQGQGDPSPERVRSSPGLQGQKRTSGTTSAGQQRGEDEATD